MITDVLASPAPGTEPSTSKECQSFVELLTRRAAQHPNDVAFRFLQNGVEEACVLTYSNLDCRVRSLAARLQQEQMAGERVVLLDPSGPESVIGILACLYAGAIGVPLYPPLPNRHFSRLHAVCLDAKPRAALATKRVFEKSGDEFARLAESFGLRMLANDDPCDTTADDWVCPDLNRDSVGYLQYTSGSTLDAKGVMITHGNLLHNCETIARAAHATRDDVGVNWLPLFHDMGLVGNVFVPLFVGFPLVCMPPEAFVMKPFAWLKAISQYGGTIAAAPDFAFNHCLQRTTPQQQATLDLSRWRVAFNGAERINGQTLERFAEAFAPSGFRIEAFLPCYGLAEATLFVTGSRRDRAYFSRQFDAASLGQGVARRTNDGIPLVSCGDPHGDAEVVIVDPELEHPCAEERIGEIWVTGRSVTAGYWNRAQTTVEKYLVRDLGNGFRRYLRTGDLGFLHEGELFVTGRLKDLVIIGGHNIYPDDVDAAAESAHAAVCHGGAFAFAASDFGGPEQLVVVVEIDQRKLDGETLHAVARSIRSAVAKSIDVAVNELVLVKRNSLPRTTNGKKKRAACRDEFARRQLKRLVDP